MLGIIGRKVGMTQVFAENGNRVPVTVIEAGPCKVLQFKTDKIGSVDKIIIDDCPDLGVALIGRPGSIGEVLVRNSEGIRLALHSM